MLRTTKQNKGARRGRSRGALQSPPPACRRRAQPAPSRGSSPSRAGANPALGTTGPRSPACDRSRGGSSRGRGSQMAASLRLARVPPSGALGGPSRAHPGERCLCLKVTTERASAVPGPGAPVPGRRAEVTAARPPGNGPSGTRGPGPRRGSPSSTAGGREPGRLLSLFRGGGERTRRPPSPSTLPAGRGPVSPRHPAGDLGRGRRARRAGDAKDRSPPGSESPPPAARGLVLPRGGSGAGRGPGGRPSPPRGRRSRSPPPHCIPRPARGPGRLRVWAGDRGGPPQDRGGGGGRDRGGGAGGGGRRAKKRTRERASERAAGACPGWGAGA